jgi:hypothetical protein
VHLHLDHLLHPPAHHLLDLHQDPPVSRHLDLLVLHPL